MSSYRSFGGRRSFLPTHQVGPASRAGPGTLRVPLGSRHLLCDQGACAMATATATASQKRMYIDGKWCDADSGRTLGVINPATEDVLAEVAYGGRDETRRALEAAGRALPGWMK